MKQGIQAERRDMKIETAGMQIHLFVSESVLMTKYIRMHLAMILTSLS